MSTVTRAALTLVLVLALVLVALMLVLVVHVVLVAVAVMTVVHNSSDVAGTNTGGRPGVNVSTV